MQEGAKALLISTALLSGCAVSPQVREERLAVAIETHFDAAYDNQRNPAACERAPGVGIAPILEIMKQHGVIGGTEEFVLRARFGLARACLRLEDKTKLLPRTETFHSG